MLHIDSVIKRYDAITALDGVSLDIARGEFFGLLGPNGAGKSTFMSLVAGLRAPDSGTITLDGTPLSPANVATRVSLGLVPQGIALYDDLSAEQNLRIFGELYGLRGADLRRRIDEALTVAQLADRRRDQVKTFSGGMQRRLNLVAALLHRPKLLLCDEPAVGVDPQSRNAIFDFLEKLNREGLTIIYSTHYMEEATRLCETASHPLPRRFDARCFCPTISSNGRGFHVREWCALSRREASRPAAWSLLPGSTNWIS